LGERGGGGGICTGTSLDSSDLDPLGGGKGRSGGAGRPSLLSRRREKEKRKGFSRRESTVVGIDQKERRRGAAHFAFGSQQ